jgi:5'-deoxynucleotidase YfbR-like HD superfamily hydrolase
MDIFINKIFRPNKTPLSPHQSLAKHFYRGAIIAQLLKNIKIKKLGANLDTVKEIQNHIFISQ